MTWCPLQLGQRGVTPGTRAAQIHSDPPPWGLQQSPDVRTVIQTGQKGVSTLRGFIFISPSRLRAALGTQQSFPSTGPSPRLNAVRVPQEQGGHRRKVQRLNTDMGGRTLPGNAQVSMEP